MRRILSAILVFIAVFLLFGCQSTSTPASTQNETYPTIPTTEPSEETAGQQESLQHPMYTISLPQTTETTTANDGNVVFRYAYQNITLILPEAEVADRVILDYLNQQDAVTAYAQTAAETAKQSYSDNGQWNAHLLQMLYTPMRFDGGVLSLYGDKVSYTGGAHSVYSGQSLNYDLLTGNKLMLTDIIRSDISADALKQKIVDALSAVAEARQLFPSYTEMVSHLIPTDLSVCINWYFADESLCFYFAPGEIAPYASGSIVAEIPYAQLTDLMLDAYFPAEEMPENGTVTAQIFDTADLPNFNRFSELILQKDSKKILLHADATVYDVRICEITASEGTHDVSNAVLYAAHTLSAKDAILIEADFNTALLMLSYYTEDGLQQFTLTVDEDLVSLNKI